MDCGDDILKYGESERYSGNYHTQINFSVEM